MLAPHKEVGSGRGIESLLGRPSYIPPERVTRTPVRSRNTGYPVRHTHHTYTYAVVGQPVASDEDARPAGRSVSAAHRGGNGSAGPSSANRRLGNTHASVLLSPVCPPGGGEMVRGTQDSRMRTPMSTGCQCTLTPPVIATHQRAINSVHCFLAYHREGQSAHQWYYYTSTVVCESR